MDFAAIAEQQWHIPLRHATGEEYVGPCPFCRQATDDGFHVWAERGNYWCRKCGIKGWVSESNREFTEQELTDLRLRALERKVEEHDRLLAALDRMHRCMDHLTYHQQMDADGYRGLWYEEGLFDTIIDRHKLGVCYGCPTDLRDRMSMTIPVVNGGKLVNIRHRLIGADNGDKYRPHMAHLGNTLFNADNVYADASQIIITEGEKKSLQLEQQGFLSVGTMGKTGFEPAWAKRFDRFQQVYVALDPDAIDKGRELAQLFGKRGRVVKLPDKADDFFTVCHGTPAQFREYLAQARRVD